MTSTHGKGLKRSTASKIAHRLGAGEHPDIAASLATALPPSAQLVPCARLDQNGSETCPFHSATAACWTAHNATGKPMPFIGSQVCLASCTYADGRSAGTPAGQPLPPLVDGGSELQDVATALKAWGLAPMGTPIVGRTGLSDVPDDVPGVPFPEPVLTQVEAAGSTIITGEYSIPVDANAPRLVAASIVAGIPVWLGTSVGAAFQALTADQIAQPTPESDDTQGGHAMYISGYRTAADGSYEFRVENSWGTAWCDNGACWASTAWLLACWDLWPFPVPMAS